MVCRAKKINVLISKSCLDKIQLVNSTVVICSIVVCLVIVALL